MNSHSAAAAFASVGLLLGALAVACSSSSSSSNSPPPPCNEDPFECAKGQTCWITDQTPTFACLNSGPGTAGQSCTSTVGVPGCADGLLCLQTVATSPGTCLPYCDPTNTAHACPGGQACEMAAFNGNTAALIHVCSGVSTGPADSGVTDTGGGTPDTGTDTGSEAAGD